MYVHLRRIRTFAFYTYVVHKKKHNDKTTQQKWEQTVI